MSELGRGEWGGRVYPMATNFRFVMLNGMLLEVDDQDRACAIHLGGGHMLVQNDPDKRPKLEGMAIRFDGRSVAETPR